jgi:hypothetical protein
MSWQAWDFGASGLTLIDGANIITGTILANAIKSKSISANQIASGSIDTSLLTFTPVTSGTGGATDLAKQVVAAINSDQEGGLKIVANKLTLTGLLQVGGAAADINSGATLISGGKIQTDSIDAAAIKAGAITTDKLTIGTVQRQNLLVNGHFGTYNTFGNSAAGWGLNSAVSFVSQLGAYLPGGSTVALHVPSLQANPGGGMILAQQVVTVIPGRQYTLVGMLYHDAGTAGIRVFTAKGSGDYELSSNTSAGTPAGSIVPAFYQNATYISNGASASSVINRWNLYGYRVTIPTDVTQVAIQICGWTTGTTNYYPGFIQFYDDNLTEATASLDMVNQLQNVAFGGDVSGNYAAITVNRINNRNVSPAAPNNGNVLTWNSTSSWWEPNNMSGIFGYTPANKAGDTFTGAVVLNTGAFSSASTGVSLVTLVGGGLGSLWAGKTYFGDGTGWKYAFSRRSAGVDTDVLTIQDNGNITALGSISATTGSFSGGTLSVSGGTPTLQILDQVGQNPRIVFMGKTNAWFWIDSPPGGFLRISNGGAPGTGAVLFYTDGSVSMGALTATSGIFNGSLSATTGTFNSICINPVTLDLSGLDQATWYPVTISIPRRRRTRMRIMVALDSGTVPNWSTHSLGFSVLCDWTSNGNGWGTVPVTRTIHTYTYSFSNVSPVGGISQMTNSSIEVVYLRGGGKYLFEADYPVTPVIQTTSYTNASQTVSPSTSLINDVFSSANAPVAFGSGIFSGALTANGGISATTGTFSGNVYLANTNTGINGSGFSLNAGNGYALRFWDGADAYSIGMNDYTSTSFGNNGYNTGGADYNMCFRMDGYDSKRGGSDCVARGFLFRNNAVGSNTFAQLAPFGNYSYWGGMLMLRDSGNNNMYGLFVLNGVLYLKQMA